MSFAKPAAPKMDFVFNGVAIAAATTFARCGRPTLQPIVECLIPRLSRALTQIERRVFERPTCCWIAESSLFS